MVIDEDVDPIAENHQPPIRGCNLQGIVSHIIKL